MPQTQIAKHVWHLLQPAIVLAGLSMRPSFLKSQPPATYPAQQEKCGAWQVLTPEQRRYLDIEVESAIYPIVRHMLEQYFAQGVRQVPDVLRIPVVFNVVWNTPAENVPDWQLLAQLDTLNKLFRLRNLPYAQLPPYFASVAADVRIEFCLAKRDPQGNPTTGIRRQFTNRTCFNLFEERDPALGGMAPWPTNQYLNIWVVDMCGGGLGVATFPYTTTDSVGVTIDYTTLPGGTPPFNQGKTAVHEVGHFLGLRHIWADAQPQCGDDKVGDTPPQDGPTYGCPNFPQPACGYTSRMFVNYMDYSDDACLHMFTQGQAARMWAFLRAVPYLQSLTRSPACALYASDAGITRILSPGVHLCTTTFSPQVELKNFGTAPLTSVDIVVAVNGAIQYTLNWSGNLAPNAQTTVTLPPITVLHSNTYVLQVWTENPNGTNDPFPLNDTAGVEFASVYRCPFTSDFELSSVRDSIPGPIWDVVNPDLETSSSAVGNNSPARTWVRLIPQEVTGAGGGPTYAAFMDLWWYSSIGQRDYLISPAFDLSGVSGLITLTFDVAYCQYNSTTRDSLIVEVSTDCGATWTRVWAAGGPSLATCPNGQTTAIYRPASPNEWNTITINLSSYAGQTIMFRFVSYNDWGNSLFIDNVALNFTPAACNLLSLTGGRLHAYLDEQRSSIFLKAELLPGATEMFQRVRLLKAEAPASTWQVLAEQEVLSTQWAFHDTEVQPDKIYLYRLEGLPALRTHWQVLDMATVSIPKMLASTSSLPELRVIVREHALEVVVRNLDVPGKVVLEDISGKRLIAVPVVPGLTTRYLLPVPDSAPRYLYIVRLVSHPEEQLLAAQKVVIP